MFETLCTFCPWFLIVYESETQRNGAVTTVYRVMPSCAIAENGRLPPLTSEAFAAVQLHQTSRSCIAQHFGGLIVGQRTKRPCELVVPLVPGCKANWPRLNIETQGFRGCKFA